MALHGAPPHPAGIKAGIIRLAANGGGIEQNLGAHQRHGPRALGIPLVPADADANPGAKHIPHLETAVARAKIVFFLIARSIRNMALAIGAHNLAIGADHRQRVVIMVPVGLEKAGGNGHLQPLGKGPHRHHRWMLRGGPGQREQRLVLNLAEIGPRKQLWRQNDLRPPGGRLLHQRGHGSDISGLVGVAQRQLQGSHGKAAGGGVERCAARAHGPSLIPPSALCPQATSPPCPSQPCGYRGRHY